jgi:hypothetical protein
MFQTACLLRSSVAAFATAAVLPSAPAVATDLGPGAEYWAAPSSAGRVPPPWLDRSFGDRWAEEDCRVVTKRHVTELGEEVLRRARICEEGPAVHRQARGSLPNRVGGEERFHGAEDMVPPAAVPDEESEGR